MPFSQINKSPIYGECQSQSAKGFAANRSANMANLNFSVTEPLLSELGLVFHYGLEIYNDFFTNSKK